MKKSLVSGLTVATALVVTFGSGVAAADNEYKGLTYAKAKEYSEQGGGTIEIASRTGEYLPTEECIVTRSRFARYLDASGRNSTSGVLMVDLNCNDKTAFNGHSGNSAATPEGAKAVKYRAMAKQLSEEFAQAAAAGKESWCQKGDNAKQCVGVCKTAGNCSAELLEYLGL